MESKQTASWMARVLNLVQMALARAARAARGLIASGNFLSQANTGGQLGPAVTVTWTSSPFTTIVGRTVNVFGSLSGTTSAVDTLVTFTLLRDGVQIGAASTTSSGHVSPNFEVALDWIDTLVAVGGPHTYAIQATAGAGTITVPQTGPATGGAVIVVQERPAP
jgi:hypothetical protein